ncbi:probable protein S-acyltransferase 22 isoform X1 [Vigna radiata var. radiata]|uniref:S-acyltransferase n=1 Tax=Vigna radiata var. radiata TaxID=3916 RepID=A0A1S3TGM7_VIGRR|nr:probable protein S-acyltransferase 22 isoform X1 [Vigna radiata var. radiata]XP_022633924.1 probable protein S-acyltransferase 22 isoform X1 [Vigna radiata var. radiata]
MRKNGWQLPYHPLQVVAIAVFLALGFAFYVFFAPFVGKKMYQYVVMGLYTPLITCVFALYIWCAASDPADPGVFKSKKYLKIPDSKQLDGLKNSKLGGESTSSMHDGNASTVGPKSMEKEELGTEASFKDAAISAEKKSASSSPSSSWLLLVCSPCAYICGCSSSSKESCDQQASEDGMFYCSLCEVEVFKYSKHCRVCDKCVDRFDHHCRWLNNCIGKRNYRKFFTLMVAALLLLILQWLTGILVLICCFVEKKKFSVDISSKLGSSFSLVPFVIVVAVCTILAMIATLPLVQLFFFHILLIKKGISTYDYIIALREQEQEQQIGGQQSPQMSPVSSLTGLSSASSFTTFHRGAWCTPPRLFLEDQFDVVPPETASVSSLGKKTARDEPVKKKNPGAVKISPWTLARLNAEEVSKAAAEARKKSKILQPVTRHNNEPFRLEPDHNSGSSGRRMSPRVETNRRRAGKRIRLPADLPMEAIPKFSSSNIIAKGFSGTSSLAPLQLEARGVFQASQAVSSSGGIVASSPESSLDSPDIHPFRVSSTEAEEARRLASLSGIGGANLKGIPLSRSTSDGYEASGGEDSDRVPSRVVQRSTNWTNLLFSGDQEERAFDPKPSSSLVHSRKL